LSASSYSHAVECFTAVDVDVNVNSFTLTSPSLC
jgi:hypothetical protein